MKTVRINDVQLPVFVMIFYTLYFENADFREGFNTTLRLGDEHYENIVKMIDADTEVIMLRLTDKYDASKNRMGRLWSVERTTYDQITVTDCASNHIARSCSALDDALERAYGRKIQGAEVVTIVGFDVIKKDNDNERGKDIPSTPRTLLLR